MGRGRSYGAWWWWVLMSAYCVGAPSGPKDASADTFNVISVENMDSLLRLRLGPSINTSRVFAGSRARRDTQALCQRHECRCTDTQHNGSNGKWLNVSCLFNEHEVVELTGENVPYNLFDITLNNMKELIIKRKAFANTPHLNRIRLSNIRLLYIESSAFRNISSALLLLDIEECAKVVMDNASFSNMLGPVRAQFSNCHHIRLGSSVFSWLLNLSMFHVPYLELVQDSFATEPLKRTRHGPAASIFFHNVTFDVIENGTFSSRVNEIKFVNCKINKTCGGAFNSMSIPGVFVISTDIQVLQTGAFSSHTLVQELYLEDSTVKIIEPNVITAVSKLSIYNSSIEELRSGAFNVSIAKTYLVGNTFTKLNRKSFEIREWDSIHIDSNTFNHLEPDTFALLGENTVGNRTIKFVNNIIKKVDVTSLAFIPYDKETEVSVWDNYFHQQCSCRLKFWTDDLVTPHELSEAIYNTSLCSVTDWLAECLTLTAGAIPMINYTQQICGTATEVHCKQQSRRSNPHPKDLSWSLLLDNEKRLITIILITVLSCVFIILLLVAAKWVQHKGLIGRIVSQFFRTSSIVATASISRMNIHDYAEIHNFQNQTQIVEESDEEEIVSIDDKATQTLPEELTQDLLQSLREKLDDPDNYREARDMIEHLYDLIKVEESCNNRTSIVVEDTLYAELQPRTRVRSRNRQVHSVGTRSPSIEKLSPVHYYPRPTVSNDYAEPRDRQVTSHVYCELPGGVPDVLVSSNMFANRPLPEAPGASHM